MSRFSEAFVKGDPFVRVRAGCKDTETILHIEGAELGVTLLVNKELGKHMAERINEAVLKREEHAFNIGFHLSRQESYSKIIDEGFK